MLSRRSGSELNALLSGRSLKNSGLRSWSRAVCVTQAPGGGRNQVMAPVSRATLQGIVDHFMNLFNVSVTTGCFARMNDTYAKLGETHNVMRTLREMLGLRKMPRAPRTGKHTCLFATYIKGNDLLLTFSSASQKTKLRI